MVCTWRSLITKVSHFMADEEGEGSRQALASA